MHFDTNLSQQTILANIIPNLNILLHVFKFILNGLFLCKHFAINHFDRDGITRANVSGWKIYAFESM